MDRKQIEAKVVELTERIKTLFEEKNKALMVVQEHQNEMVRLEGAIRELNIMLNAKPKEPKITELKVEKNDQSK